MVSLLSAQVPGTPTNHSVSRPSASTGHGAAPTVQDFLFSPLEEEQALGLSPVELQDEALPHTRSWWFKTANTVLNNEQRKPWFEQSNNEAKLAVYRFQKEKRLRCFIVELKKKNPSNESPVLKISWCQKQGGWHRRHKSSCRVLKSL